jgi:hypothetical protein
MVDIGSAGERARPPVLNFFVPDQMNRTEQNRVPPHCNMVLAPAAACTAIDFETGR